MDESNPPEKRSPIGLSDLNLIFNELFISSEKKLVEKIYFLNYSYY